MSIWHNLPFGWFGSIGDNETELVSTKSDPPKHRLAVTQEAVDEGHTLNLGGISYNISRNDRNHEEYAYLAGRLTADKQAGAFAIHVRPRGSEEVREVAYFEKDAIIFHAPVQAPNLGGNTPSLGHQLVSQDGRYLTVQQGDGNLVTYRRDPVTGALGAAVWASGFVE